MRCNVVLIRHGETKWNAAGRLQGRTDTDLSAEGWRQARLLASALPQWAKAQRLGPWHAVYASPLRRARDTAQTIADALKLPLCTDDALVERSFGEMEGLDRAELDHRFPRRHIDESNIQGIETKDAAAQRARGVLQRIAQQHGDENVLVVSHGSLLRCFINSVLNNPPSEEVAQVLDNGAYNWVVWQPETNAWTVRALNVTSHLSPQ